MGLFNFAKPSSNNGGEDIVIIVGDEQITVPAAEAAGLTVEQLFERFASNIADVSRINRFVSTGRVINGTAPAESGTVYSGAIASESKG